MQTRKKPIDPIMLSLSLLMLLFVPLSAAPAPVKLAIVADKYSVWTGQDATLEVRLLDADNQAAAASKPWPLTLDVSAPDGSVTTLTLTMAAGESSKTIQLPVAKAGIWRVSAKDAQLLDGAIMLNAMNKPAERGDEAGLSIEQILRARQGIVPQVELRLAPQRTLLADGRDSATIYGLLSGDDAIATNDIRLRLHNSDGTLQPAELLIAKGDFSGTAQLVSDHPGEIAVEYLGAVPAVKLVGNERLSAKFGVPITKMEIKASPPQISLFESAEVVVRLLGSNAVPLASDDARTMLLTIEQGGGQLDSNEFSIAAGSAEGRTLFKPSAVGAVVLAAASPNLVSVQTVLQVTWPLALLFATALGGLAGGLLAFVTEKEARWWRSLIGLVTGFVLYWSVVFVGIADLAGAYAINPLSAFAIAVIGGWAGTKVFTPLLKRLGLSA